GGTAMRREEGFEIPDRERRVSAGNGLLDGHEPGFGGGARRRLEVPDVRGDEDCAHEGDDADGQSTGVGSCPRGQLQDPGDEDVVRRVALWDAMSNRVSCHAEIAATRVRNESARGPGAARAETKKSPNTLNLAGISPSVKQLPACGT